MTNALGTLIEKMQYDAYGRLTGLWVLGHGPITPVNGFISTETYYSDSITQNPYLFQSQRLDAETGLYYFKNRYYDPIHGRFISRDPAGMTDGPNLYAFVNNNPINFVDPLGLACEVLPPSWYWEVSGGGGELDFLWGAASSVSGFGAAVMGGMILETVFCGPQMAATWDPELYVYLNTPPRFDGFYYPSQEESDQAYLNHISKKSYLEMSDGELKFVWEHAPGRFGLFWYQAQTDKVNAAWQKEHPGCDIFFAVMADPDLRKELDDKSLPLFIQSQGEEAQKAGYELVEKMRRLQQAIDNYASGVIDVNGLAAGGWTSEELEFIKDKVERHHLLPKQFKPYFKAVGLNIEDYTIDLTKSKHRLKPNGIHTGTENWNRQWKNFFDAHRDSGYTQEDVQNQLATMKVDFGLE
jgi:RHS repeat-associated protein